MLPIQNGVLAQGTGNALVVNVGHDFHGLTPLPIFWSALAREDRHHNKRIGQIQAGRNKCGSGSVGSWGSTPWHEINVPMSVTFIYEKIKACPLVSNSL